MIHPFREKTPTRRTDRAECVHYSSYHKTLREDFNKRCGYCDDYDKLRIRSFTIDHFVPQNPKDFTHSIKPNYYYNLVYSCRYCNSSKTNKWPTNDEKLHHNGKEGFVDPTEDHYTVLFKRSFNGKIAHNNGNIELAQYIITELKLWLPIHERMWKLERISKLNELIQSKLDNVLDDTLKIQIEQIHYQVLKIWKELQDSIFVDNE